MNEQPILNTFLMLIFSVGMLGGLFYFLKKYIEKSKGENNSTNIKIITKQSLAHKSHLYVIEIESRRFLLASAEKNISLISELNSHSNQTDAKPDIQKSNDFNASSLSFKEFLKSTISKG